MPTVATVATVAVARFEIGESAGAAAPAELRSFRWRIVAPGREPFEVRCSPGATAAELLALYPSARCEPIAEPDSPRLAAEFQVFAEAGEPKARLPADSRRRCADCANLAPGGRCRAAARGELAFAVSPRYAPAPDVLRRCEGYAPGPADADRRSGRERWPGLADDPPASGEADHH